MRFSQNRILTLSLLIPDMANSWCHADILLLTTSYLFGHRSNLGWTLWNEINAGSWLLSALKLKSISLQDMQCTWFIYYELCFSIHVHGFLARLLLSGAVTDGLMGLCMQAVGEECHGNVARSRLILDMFYCLYGFGCAEWGGSVAGVIESWWVDAGAVGLQARWVFITLHLKQPNTMMENPPRVI